MNDPEVTMSNAVAETKLVAHEKAVEAAGSDPQTTAEKEGWVEVSHRLLAGGGESRCPKGASNYWRIAYASAEEVDSHLRLLVHAGSINRSRANDALETFDRVRAMTWRLLNPRT